MSTRDKVIELRRINPKISGVALAIALGISKQRVSQVIMQLEGRKSRGRKSSVLNHPDCGLIEIELMLGFTLRRIAKTYGLGIDAIHRHGKKMPRWLQRKAIAYGGVFLTREYQNIHAAIYDSLGHCPSVRDDLMTALRVAACHAVLGHGHAVDETNWNLESALAKIRQSGKDAR